MNEKIKQICDAIGALPDDRRTDVFLYAFTGGEVSQQIRIDHLKALASHALRVEKMLEKAVYIEFDQWAIYNNYPFAGKPGDGKIRLFKKNETNQSFDVREFDSVLEAYEARETFEATQNDSNGR